MQYIADILVKTSDGILAVVEIKNRLGINTEIATAFRRNIIVHRLGAEAPYFLLLSEERGYLWHKALGQDGLPTVEFSMAQIVERYLPNRDRSRRLSGEQLELLAVQWLTELSLGIRDEFEEPESELAITGFLTSMRGASILVEAPV